MIRLLTIIGARPQIIKAAAISRAINNHFQGQIEESILHTGQHYDTNMSSVFFDELGIPEAEKKALSGVGAQFDSEMVYHKIQDKLKEKQDKKRFE